MLLLSFLHSLSMFVIDCLMVLVAMSELVCVFAGLHLCFYVLRVIVVLVVWKLYI